MEANFFLGFIFGGIAGMITALIVFIVVKSNEADVVRMLERTVEISGGKQKAYIAGLPEEVENVNRKILDSDKDIKID